MRIHKIEVLNLNSLVGEQTLDLDADLAGASLFLIQGPTGAGKSTLLDAISLALFGQTPRFPDGAEQVVISRGTGEARARVEFSTWSPEGRRRYRASWSARRARNRPDGAVQPVVRQLEAWEDGTWVTQVTSSKKKDFVEPFTQALQGFSADEFQRSLLLAQGQFDKLLHAAPEQRAALLERLTRSTDYAALGRRVADMNRAHQERLRKLRLASEALGLRPPEVQAEDQAALGAATAAEAAARSAAERAQAALRWIDEDHQHRQTVAAAALAEAEARRAWEDAAEERALLADQERLDPAFRALDAAEEAQAARAALQARLVEEAANLERRGQAVSLRQDAAERAEQDRAQAQAAEVALRPALEVVVERGREARVEREAAQKVEAEVAELRREEAAAEQRAQQARDRLQQRVRGEAAARAALDARRADEGLGAALPDLRAAVEAWRVAETAASSAREAASRGEAALREDQRQLALEAAKRDELAQALAPLDSAAQAATERAADQRREAERQAPQGLRQAQEEATDLGQRALTAAEALSRAAQAEVASADRRRQAQAAQEACALARHAQAAGQERVERAQAALTEAEGVLAPLTRIFDLVQQRDALIPGEACPLCGAQEHPFVDHPAQAPLVALAAERQAALSRREQARRDLTEAEAARQRADQEVSRQEALAQVALTEASHARERADREVEAARAARTALGLSAEATLSEVEAAGAAAGQRRAALRELEATLVAAEQEALAAQDRQRAARSAWEKVQSAWESRAERITRQTAEVSTLRAQALAQEDAARGSRERVDALAQAWGLSAPDPGQQREEAELRHQAWQKALAEVDAAARARELAEQAAAAGEEVRLQAAARTSAAKGRLEVAADRARQADLATEAAWGALRAAWTAAALPAPTAADPSAWRQALEAHRQKADQRAKQTADALALAREEMAGAASRFATLTQDEQAATARRDLTRAALDQALGEAGLGDADGLRARRLAPARRAAARAAEEARLSALHRAEAHRSTLQGAREHHLARQPAAVREVPERATWEQRQLEHAAEAARWQTQARDLAGRLQEDQRKARDQEDLQRRTSEAEAAAAPWSALHQLIGVRDGERFKQFAQALNLGQLLRQANLHLARLAPRYQLGQEQEEDGLPTLQLQVHDRWRPGGPRPLKSLSGGESFLFSLALALGLSELRTSTLPIETLLLDEGFGTLDPETLEVALAALDQLQSSGRRVGLISHVVALRERIPAQVLIVPVGEGASEIRRPTVRV